MESLRKPGASLPFRGSAANKKGWSLKWKEHEKGAVILGTQFQGRRLAVSML